MNEITRIHLARIAYDIEPTAKEQLQAYFDALGKSGADEEISSDIEIRMTEILAERGVKKDGVITADDVEALEAQLGEPSDFMMDDGDTPEEIEPIDRTEPHRLFRSTDRAMVGGVLAGIGEFFAVDPLWVRLVFIVGVIATGGTAILLYLVLWLVVPPVRSAADRLQLRGQPVTASSIRQLNKKEGPINRSHERRVGRIITIILGIGFAAAATIAAVATIAGTTALGNRVHDVDTVTYFGSHRLELYGIFALSIACGVLLTLLFGLGAYAFFARKLTRRIVVGGICIIVAGLIAMAGVVGLGVYSSDKVQQSIQRHVKKQEVAVSGSLADARQLVLVGNTDYQTTYVVSNGRPHARVSFWDGEQTGQPHLAVKGKTLTVSFDEKSLPSEYPGGYFPELTIYGPALSSVEGQSRMNISYVALNQPELTLSTTADSSVSLTGQIRTLTATLGRNTSLDGENAALGTVKLTADAGSQALFATVKSLDLTADESCAADGATSVELQDITGQTMIINGKKVDPASYDWSCIRVRLDEEE